MLIAIGIIGGAILLIILYFTMGIRFPRGDGFEFVYMDDQGRVRELDEDEKEYLTMDFEPGDGGRPYMKDWWRQRTPDYRLRGYIARRHVPIWIRIHGAPERAKSAELSDSQ